MNAARTESEKLLDAVRRTEAISRAVGKRRCSGFTIFVSVFLAIICAAGLIWAAVSIRSKIDRDRAFRREVEALNEDAARRQEVHDAIFARRKP